MSLEEGRTHVIKSSTGEVPHGYKVGGTSRIRKGRNVKGARGGNQETFDQNLFSVPRTGCTVSTDQRLRVCLVHTQGGRWVGGT